MAASGRQPDPAVAWERLREELEERPGSFDFFQAVRVLGNLQRGADAVRFSTNSDLAFPSSQIESLHVCDTGRVEIAVNFLGLTGPMGALPYFYSELINDRERAKDFAPKSFLDIFHHRLVALFYRAWQKHRFPVLWEQNQPDGVSEVLLALLGLLTDGLQDRQRVPDQDLSFYAGLLAIQTRPASTLEQILADYFETAAAIEQFCGGWFLLPESSQCRLGNESCFEQLEEGAVLGDAVWNQQSKVRIKLGPMPLARYLEFLPTGKAHPRLEALVDFFASRQFDFELQLVLERTEAPELELGAELPLGWCSWLDTSELETDPDDAILPLGQQLCM